MLESANRAMEVRFHPGMSPDPVKRFVASVMKTFIAIALLFVANGWMTNGVQGYQNPDELIPVRTIQHMVQTGTLDTDWAHADLPEEFRRVHFNFSGYIVSGYAFVSLFAPDSVPDDMKLLDSLRRFSRLLTLGTAALVFLMLRRTFGWSHAVVMGLAILLTPLIFQDAHYARPEALGTLLFTLCFLMTLQAPGHARKQLIRIVVILGIAGFLTSVKVTYVLAAVFVLPIASRFLPGGALAGHARTHLPMALVFGTLCFIGCAMLGAPYAFAHPGEYLAGLRSLQVQYTGGHPPHSLADYSLLKEGVWIATYFIGTLGWAIILLHPLGYLSRKTRPAMLAFLAILLFMLAMFASQRVFFERNLSHLVPPFLIVSFGGLHWLFEQARTAFRGRTASIATITGIQVAVLLLALWTPYVMAKAVRHMFLPERIASDRQDLEGKIQAVQSRIGASEVRDIDYPSVFSQRLPALQECVLYRVATYEDDWSRQFIDSLQDTATIDYVRPSRFAALPTSTLHTYHHATIYLLHGKGACQEHA